MESMYKINKGINRPVVFQGIEGQYIWWLGAGVLLLLILFMVLHFAGMDAYISLLIVGAGGMGLFAGVYKLSNSYGTKGLGKKLAKRQLPGGLNFSNRTYFKKPFK
jgi:hypothetical protein